MQNNLLDFLDWLQAVLIANGIELEKIGAFGYEELTLPEAINILKIISGSLGGRFVSYDDFYNGPKQTFGLETFKFGNKQIFQGNDYFSMKQMADMGLIKWANKENSK